MRSQLTPLALLLILAPYAIGQGLQEAPTPDDDVAADSQVVRYAVNASPRVAEADTLDLYKVRFRFAPEITPSQVYLRGSFSGWSPAGDRMSGPDPEGAFELVKFLPPGLHEYHYVVDGVSVVDSGPPADFGSASENGISGFPGLRADNRFEKVILQKGDGEFFAGGLGLGPGATSVTRISLETLALATRVNRGDVDSASILFRSAGIEQEYPLRESGQDSLFVYYRGEIQAGIGTEGRIGVRLHDGDSSRVVTTAGLERAAPLSRLLPVGPMHTPLLEVPAWVTSGVHYHIEPDLFRNGNGANDPKQKNERHGGDLEGVLEKLSWIDDLHVTAISFSPLHDSPSPLRFDSGDFRKVGSGIGGDKAFRLVVDEAHRRDIRVIVTITLHSTSDEHYAFTDALKKGGASEYSTWYEWRQWPIPKQFSGEQRPPDYYACLDEEGNVPSLNFDLAHSQNEEIHIENRRDAEVNESLLAEIDSTLLFWLTDMDVDGLILDDPARTPLWLNRHVREFTKRIKPDAYIAGHPPPDSHFKILKKCFDGVDYDLENGIGQFLMGGSAESFARWLASQEAIRPVNELRASSGRLSQNHRIRPATRWGPKGALIGYTHLLTSPGFPQIQWGDEIGMTGEESADDLSPYPWDNLLEPSRLAIRDQFRRLLSIRHDHPALAGGEERILLAEGSVLIRARLLEEDALLILLNAGENAAEIDVETAALPFAGGGPIELLTGLPVVVSRAGERFSIRLEGRSSAILHFPAGD